MNVDGGRMGLRRSGDRKKQFTATVDTVFEFEHVKPQVRLLEMRETAPASLLSEFDLWHNKRAKLGVNDVERASHTLVRTKGKWLTCRQPRYAASTFGSVDTPSTRHM